VVDPGFLAVYEEGRDEKTQDDEAAPTADRMPKLGAARASLPLSAILAEQHFTEPPPRYSEASLVKALEEHGIGRPSTYASIIQVLLNREYVFLDAAPLPPTDVGRAVAKFLSGHFTQYVDYDFTAKLEDELDAVSRGEEDWVPLLRASGSRSRLRSTTRSNRSTRPKPPARACLGVDPKSGKPVSVRLGRYGPFAQIGTKDDEDKPRFASCARPEMHSISLEEALELFEAAAPAGQDEKARSERRHRPLRSLRQGRQHLCLDPGRHRSV
jgi:DNA topoisomerase-1